MQPFPYLPFSTAAAPLTATVMGTMMASMVRLFLILILQLASGDCASNRSEKTMIAVFLACKPAGQASDYGAAQPTFALRNIRVIRRIRVLWWVTLLLVLWRIWIVIWLLLLMLAVRGLLWRIWVVTPVVLWCTTRKPDQYFRNVDISQEPERLTNIQVDPVGYWRHTPHTEHLPAHAGNLRAVAGHKNSLFEAVRSLLGHRHIEELVAGILAAGHTVVTDRTADSPAEEGERSSLAGTGCRDQTWLRGTVDETGGLVVETGSLRRSFRCVIDN